MYTFSGQRYLWSLVCHRSSKRYSIFRHPQSRHQSVERCCRPGVSGLVRPNYFFPPLREQIPGGADTTASAIGTFFLAMVCYPEAQKEAQAELDKVLNGRLPEHSNFTSLTYLLALVKEVYRYSAVNFKYSMLLVNCVSRWKPITPLSMPFFVSNIVTSWHPCQWLVKVARISRPAIISTMAIISPSIQLW